MHDPYYLSCPESLEHNRIDSLFEWWPAEQVRREVRSVSIISRCQLVIQLSPAGEEEEEEEVIPR